MAEYNQDRFELEVVAKEVEPPQRLARAKVIVCTCRFNHSTLNFTILTISLNPRFGSMTTAN